MVPGNYNFLYLSLPFSIKIKIKDLDGDMYTFIIFEALEILKNELRPLHF